MKKKLLCGLFFIGFIYSIANRPDRNKNQKPLWFEQFKIIEKNYIPRYNFKAVKWLKLFSVLPKDLKHEIVNHIDACPALINSAQDIKQAYFYSLCGDPHDRKILVRAIEERIQKINALQDNYKREVFMVLWTLLLSLSNDQLIFLGRDLMWIINESKKIVNK